MTQLFYLLVDNHYHGLLELDWVSNALHQNSVHLVPVLNMAVDYSGGTEASSEGERAED